MGTGIQGCVWASLRVRTLWAGILGNLCEILRTQTLEKKFYEDLSLDSWGQCAGFAPGFFQGRRPGYCEHQKMPKSRDWTCGAAS